MPKTNPASPSNPRSAQQQGLQQLFLTAGSSYGAKFL